MLKNIPAHMFHNLYLCPDTFLSALLMITHNSSFIIISMLYLCVWDKNLNNLLQNYVILPAYFYVFQRWFISGLL